MKKLLAYLLLSLLFVSPAAFAIDNAGSGSVKLQCKGDAVKRTRNNAIVGDIYVFTLQNGQLYDNEGKLIRNATITDDSIKGTARFRNGLTLEVIKFTINRYSGVFSYYKTSATLDNRIQSKNSGICEIIKNEKLF